MGRKLKRNSFKKIRWLIMDFSFTSFHLLLFLTMNNEFYKNECNDQLYEYYENELVGIKENLFIHTHHTLQSYFIHKKKRKKNEFYERFSFVTIQYYHFSFL